MKQPVDIHVQFIRIHTFLCCPLVEHGAFLVGDGAIGYDRTDEGVKLLGIHRKMIIERWEIEVLFLALTRL